MSRTDLTRLAWLAASMPLALPWLAGCNGSAGAPANLSAPSLTNLGLAGAPGELAGEDALWLFAARESDSGGRDLNGDGDAFDRVVYVQDLASGLARNTGLALETRGPAASLRVGTRLALFAASEPASAGTDLNGDGDANDAVLYVVEVATRSTRGLSLALALDALPAVEDDLAAFVVSEAAQGNRDLDGDGSSAGAVLHLYRGAQRTLVNTRRAVSSSVFLGDGRVAYFAAESSADLNGDGDRLDRAVLQVYDPGSDTNTNTGLATLGSAPLHAAGAWLVVVPEFEQGADLNGDGDLEDFVLHVFDAATGAVRNLGFSSGGPGAELASTLPGGERFGLLVPELDGFDLNGDGDLADSVALLYDPRTERLTNTRRATVRIAFAGQWLGFLALESAQGGAQGPATDLNGDGDVLDAVAMLLDPLSGGVTNLKQDALDLVGSDKLLLLLRPESGSNADWNLDGDRDDVVVHAHDPAANTTINTGIAAAGVFGATPSALLLAVDEAAEGRDLNADGDRVDAVFVRVDLVRRRSSNFALASSGPSGFAALTRAGQSVLLASEAAQGRDLNGDGDLADEVLYRAQ